MILTHRALGTWRRPTRFIALSEFARDLLVHVGIPQSRIVVKPNFADVGEATPPVDIDSERYVAFVGRLSPEKGLGTLLEAWRMLEEPIPLVIAGDGPMRPTVERLVSDATNAPIRMLGQVPKDKVCGVMAHASFVVVPSEWFEVYPGTLAESFAQGTPVVASRVGSLAELVRDGVTGKHFRAGDPAALAAVVTQLWNDPEQLCRLGANARSHAEKHYSADRTYETLISVYEAAISEATG